MQQPTTETIRGEGIEITIAYGENNSIHYDIHGQGMTPDAGIWIGNRTDLLRMLLEPVGCAECNGRIERAN